MHFSPLPKQKIMLRSSVFKRVRIFPGTHPKTTTEGVPDKKVIGARPELFPMNNVDLAIIVETCVRLYMPQVRP